jgi:hypothetical protein
MIDDAWIADLERRTKPLRVELPPWGEVLAREALRAPPREPAPRPHRWRLAVLATAAAAGVVWAWPRPAPQTEPIPIPMVVHEQMTVASPIVMRPPEITPPPSPAAASEDPLASAPPEPTPRPRTPRRVRRPSPPRTREHADVTPTVDCILDPSLCHRSKTAAPPSDELPETLGTADIKRGLDGVRPQIHDCGRVHGAIPKQKVTIKITISGETGMVTQANIVKPQLAVGLEQCILAAMHRATFPRFRKERLGAMFPVTMP